MIAIALICLQWRFQVGQYTEIKLGRWVSLRSRELGAGLSQSSATDPVGATKIEHPEILFAL